MRRKETMPQYRWKHHWTRALALTLVFALFIPTSVLAFPDYVDQPEKPKGGICVHHPEHTEACGGIGDDNGSPCTHEHDESCGYSAPSGGTPCTHEHDGSCGYTPGAEEIPCDKGCTETDETGAVVHTSDCAYTPAVGGTPCTHEHDESCGYSAPSEGSPCTHEHDENCGYIPAAEDSHCSYMCDLCVTDWQWDDPDELLVWNEDIKRWCLGLPGADGENTVIRETLAAMLPERVTAVTAAGERIVELIWDLDEFPEEGVCEGACTLTAALSGEYVLTEAAPELSVLLEIGGGGVYADPVKKYLNQWRFIDRNGNKIEGAAIDAAKAGLDKMSQDEIIQWLKDTVLPTRIRGWSAPDTWGGSEYKHLQLDDKNQSEAKYETTANGQELQSNTLYKWGFVDIEWNSFPDELKAGETYTLVATTKLVTNVNTYQIIVNSNDPQDHSQGTKDTESKPEILSLSVTLKQTQTGYPGPVRQVDVVPGRHKFVNDWEYVPSGSMTGLSCPDGHHYSASLAVQQNQMTVGDVMARLPKRIKGTASYDKVLVEAGFKDYTGTSGMVEGYVDIEWKIQGVDTADAVSDGENLTFYAEPKSNPGYELRVNSNDANYKDSGNDRADTAEASDILNLTVTVRGFDPSDHIVTAAKPENVTVNLFDYWVQTQNPTTATNGDILTKNDWHKNADGQPVARTGVSDWNKGINTGRLLLFGDGLIHAGLWNKGAGAITGYGTKHAGMQGLVLPQLQDGYPVVNVGKHANHIEDYTEITDYILSGEHLDGGNDPATNPATPAAYDSKDPENNISNIVYNAWETSGNTASLDYLFDPAPAAAHPNKTSYTNVTGLFQLDQNGYYYYNMRENFAEFSQDGGNHFTLYNAPATVRTDGKNSIGNFFPFNTASQVFDGLSEDGKTLTSSVACSNNEMNHHLGMTVSVDFRQPLDGMVNTGSNAQPMTFQFSGDDDVWVFIDDVLVLDMGGIHSEVYGIIDFADGDVLIGRGFDTNGIPDYDPENPGGTQDLVTHTKLWDLYKAAEMTDATRWDGKTFESNTTHTLKMFYLERGNYDSSLALRFNLQPMLYQQIRKVDQNGNAVENVEFKLYPAEITADADDPGAIACLYTDSDVQGRRPFHVRQKTGSSALVKLTTGPDGSAQFRLDDGSLFNFADQKTDYYILHESTTPSGYRSQPVDIVLHYDHATAMLSVANRWTTGAYACSVAHITGPFNADQEEGVTVAVPLLKKSGGWYPLYGNNLSGFQTIHDTGDAGILLAALHQIKGGYADWHLSWDDGNSRLYGTLSDLPGLAGRYTLLNPGGDIMMKYIQISSGALNKLGISGRTADERYQNLQTCLQGQAALEDVRNTIADDCTELSAGAFIRDFRSLIYIPNERRELWVMKVDEDGRPLSGAQFGLFRDAACTAQAAAGFTDDNGMLVFSPSGDNNIAGQARMVWANSTPSDQAQYYLKEIAAPAGCELNDTAIPVVVGHYSIYADAGKADNGVSVMAGVGRLTQTMHQFAMDNDVDITLQDITAFMQSQPSGSSFTLAGWQDVKLANTEVPRSMNLHYGINNDNFKLVDYVLHKEDGGEFYQPFFVTDTGFARVRVQQISAAAKAGYQTVHASDASWENLAGIDLTNLFNVLNIVVVTDRHDPEPTTPTTQLTVSKKVEGTGLNDADYTKLYSFKVTLADDTGTSLGGTYQYNFYGKDKWGYVSDGGTLLLHHDESVTILGLPEGTRFTVTETNLETGWHVTPGQTITGETSEDGPAKAEFINSTTRPVNPETPPVNPGGPPSDPKDPDPKDPPDLTPPPESPTQLPDPNDPNSPDRITIWENGVPVTYVKWWDPEKMMWVYIPESMIPLSYIPDTGDTSPLWLYALAALLTGSTAIRNLTGKKNKGGNSPT